MNTSPDPIQPPDIQKRTWLATVFFSPDEPRLRLLWRFLFMFLLTIVLSIPLLVLVGLFTLFGIIPANSDLTLVSVIPTGIATIAAILFARHFFDRRSITSMGLKVDRRAFPDLLAGIVIAGLMMGSIYLTEYALGWLKFEAFTYLAPSSLLPLLGWGVAFLLVGFYEEMLFRGYLFQNLEEGLNTFWAVLITCVLFSAAHLGNPNFNWGSVLGLVLSGLFFVYAFLRSRQLWLAIGLHIGWNFFEGPAFGFPVSGLTTFNFIQQHTEGPPLVTGGGFGPEAGLVLLVGLAVGTLLIHLYSRKPAEEPTVHE